MTFRRWVATDQENTCFHLHRSREAACRCARRSAFDYVAAGDFTNKTTAFTLDYASLWRAQ